MKIAKAFVYIAREDYGTMTSIKLGFRSPTGDLHVAQPIALKHYPAGEPTENESMLTIREDEASEVFQSLMDELWAFGVRPRDIGTPGHLAATQSHLKDMRAIVAKTLAVELP